MKNTQSIILLLLLVIVISSCSRSTLYTSESLYDKKKDFSSYKTYAWISDEIPVATTAYLNDTTVAKTMNYLDHCMGLKGYTIDSETPDLLIKLQILDSYKIDTVYYSESYESMYSGQNNPYEYEFPSSNLYRVSNYGVYVDPFDVTIPRKYVNRNIRVSIIDRVNKEVIWKGFAEGNLYDIKYAQYDIHPAVHDILSKYPIKAMKIKP